MKTMAEFEELLDTGDVHLKVAFESGCGWEAELWYYNSDLDKNIVIYHDIDLFYRDDDPGIESLMDGLYEKAQKAKAASAAS